MVAWPVMNGALHQQRTDAVMFALRTGIEPVRLLAVEQGIVSMDRALAYDPVATRLLLRSELLAGAALSPALQVPNERRQQWMQQAEEDLVAALGDTPARGVGWARLAAARQALGGPSRAVADAVMMSIDTAPMIETLWPARLQLILDNWRFFTPQERQRVEAQVAMNWQRSDDRRWFASVIRTPVDELFVRYFIRNEPNAQEELAKWLAQLRRK